MSANHQELAAACIILAGEGLYSHQDGLRDSIKTLAAATRQGMDAELTRHIERDEKRARKQRRMMPD